MKIYINGRFFTQQVTGVQRVAREVVNFLDLALNENTEHEFHLVVPRGAKSLPAFRNINIIHSESQFSGHLWEQLILPLVARKGCILNLCNSAPILFRNQLTVIHDMAIYRVPTAYSFLYKAWYKAVYKLLIKTKSTIVTVSEFSKREINQLMGISLKDICVLTEGREHITRLTPDFQILKKHDIENRPFILAVSSLTPNKNFQVVVKAIELMGNVDFDFVIAGGANPAVFSSDSTSLPKTVKHVGYVSDEELKALYEQASCFIFPSFYEGFGLPPMEAMACGCPVVASDRASIPEICGDAAIYFNPEDPMDVKEKLLSVMADSDLQSRLSSLGLKHVEQFSWQISAKQLMEMLNSKGLS